MKSLAWQIEWHPEALRELKALDYDVQLKIRSYLMDRAAVSPYYLSENIMGDGSGLFRYRIGNHRIICRLVDNRIVISVIKIGYRNKTYYSD